MSTHLGLNSAPVLAPLLPVTGSFALPFTAYLGWLSMRVVRLRLKEKKYMGDNTSVTGETTNPLYVATRSHQNFLENVPMAFIVAAFAELNGANRKYLTAALSALFAFRFMHAELGLQKAGSMALGRPIGYFGSSGVMLGLAGYAAYLVKGYWGF